MFEQNFCKIITNGGVGVIPSETVYGIVGSAFNESAIRRVYALKGRDENKQAIVLLSNSEQLDQFSVQERDAQRMKELWQDERPTSIAVFVENDSYPLLTRGYGTIAFRVVKGFSELADFVACTGPIIAPSANLQGEPSATNIAMARQYFGDEVDFYADGGERNGQPSRVVRIEKDGTLTTIRS